MARLISCLFVVMCATLAFAPSVQAYEQCMPPAYDIVFVVDTSPSMETKHKAIADAYAPLWMYFMDDSVRLGLVTVAEDKTESNPSIYQELGAYDDFVVSFRFATSEWRDGFGPEPTFNAVSDLITGELPFTWDEGAERIIVLVTDEGLQSTDPWCADLGAELCSDLEGTGDKLVVITPAEYAVDYGSCARVTSDPRIGLTWIASHL